jgi:hypothetical protein
MHPMLRGLMSRVVTAVLAAIEGQIGRYGVRGF